LNFFGSVQWRKTKFLGIRRLVLEVKPLPAPALDRVGEFHIKVSDFGMSTDADTTYVVDDVFRVVAAEVEDAFPEAPVRVDAHETFTKCDKNGDVKERVRGQLVQLDPVDKKQVMKEFMDNNKKAVSEEVDESYPESNGRMRRISRL
jgi:metal-sulfur cluster biosynthetic enzyme